VKKVFGSKRDEHTGDWRKLQFTELYEFYTLPRILKVIKCRRTRRVGHMTCMAQEIYEKNTEGKRILGKPRHS
jgi:hypothetical protein